MKHPAVSRKKSTIKRKIYWWKNSQKQIKFFFISNVTSQLSRTLKNWCRRMNKTVNFLLVSSFERENEKVSIQGRCGEGRKKQFPLRAIKHHHLTILHQIHHTTRNLDDKAKIANVKATKDSGERLKERTNTGRRFERLKNRRKCRVFLLILWL